MLDRDLKLLNLLEKFLLLTLFLLEVLAQLVFLSVQFPDPDLELDNATFKPVIFLILLLDRFLLMTNRPVALFVLFSYLTGHILIVSNFFLLEAEFFLHLLEGHLQSLYLCLVHRLHLSLLLVEFDPT